jgi:hypothetical protein
MNARRAIRDSVNCGFLLAALFALPAFAQKADDASAPKKSPPAKTSQPGTLKLGPVSVSGSVRFRLEAWDWFEGNAENTYAYPQYLFRLSFAQKRKRFDWQVEFAQPALLGLPDNALAAGAQGQFGFGATYFVANNRRRHVANAFVKQAFARFSQLGGQEGLSLRLGRFEFFDGAEVVPKDASLAWLKNQRIAQRLIGNFGFTNVGRSFDGAHLSWSRARANFTLTGMRATRGVFQVDGWGELDVDLVYAALTRQFAPATGAGELRVFGIGYHDGRGALKTDNRPLAARAADAQNIRLGTFGAHYLHNFAAPRGHKLDLLFWGALQTGSWGALAHRAGALALEAGWQPPLARLKPWIRFGYFRGSGDDDPADGRHGTFSQLLPTPRGYARFPLYNFQNNEDFSGMVLLRPHAKLSVRTDVHGLRLTERNDLWYQGGGAFQNTSFGYLGRPSGGSRDFGLLWDAGADFNLHPRFVWSVYFGFLAGGPVVHNIYPAGSNARFGYTEFTYRF